jgi:hypothetical protein
MGKINQFREFYDGLPKKAEVAPKTKFVKEIAKLCYKSEKTVRCWLAGTQKPDKQDRVILSKHLNIPENQLFDDVI